MKDTTGKRIRKIMSDRGLKQVDILRMCEPYCEKYGVKLAKNDLSQYVSDKVQPRQDKLSILAMALDVSEAWLMGFDVPTAYDEAIAMTNADPDMVLEAIKLYDQYRKLTPENQIAFRTLLKSLQSDS